MYCKEKHVSGGMIIVVLNKSPLICLEQGSWSSTSPDKECHIREGMNPCEPKGFFSLEVDIAIIENNRQNNHWIPGPGDVASSVNSDLVWVKSWVWSLAPPPLQTVIVGTASWGAQHCSSKKKGGGSRPWWVLVEKWNLYRIRNGGVFQQRSDVWALASQGQFGSCREQIRSKVRTFRETTWNGHLSSGSGKWTWKEAGEQLKAEMCLEVKVARHGYQVGGKGRSIWIPAFCPLIE